MFCSLLISEHHIMDLKGSLQNTAANISVTEQQIVFLLYLSSS